jgi:hypothetical protein
MDIQERVILDYRLGADEESNGCDAPDERADGCYSMLLLASANVPKP